MSASTAQILNAENTRSSSAAASSAPDENSYRGGPRTSEGKATSAENAIKDALFTARDFIRPYEKDEYAELTTGLMLELNPAGTVEQILFNEIRQAAWRLRRCAKVEARLVATLSNGSGKALDPMECVDPYAEKVQKSVDRARAQASRLMKQAMAELRKVQTERRIRQELIQDYETESEMGQMDYPAVVRAVGQKVRFDLHVSKRSKERNSEGTEAHPPEIPKAA